MRESGAWKWMLGLAAAVLVAKTGFIEAVFSVLLLLALASAILFSLALFSMDFVEAAARGLEFLEGRVCHAADRTRTRTADARGAGHRSRGPTSEPDSRGPAKSARAGSRARMDDARRRADPCATRARRSAPAPGTSAPTRSAETGRR